MDRGWLVTILVQIWALRYVRLVSYEFRNRNNFAWKMTPIEGVKLSDILTFDRLCLHEHYIPHDTSTPQFWAHSEFKLHFYWICKFWKPLVGIQKFVGKKFARMVILISKWLMTLYLENRSIESNRIFSPSRLWVINHFCKWLYLASINSWSVLNCLVKIILPEKMTLYTCQTRWQVIVRNPNWKRGGDRPRYICSSNLSKFYRANFSV